MRTIHAMYWSATDTTKTVVRTIAQALAQHAGADYHVFDSTLPASRETVKTFGPDDSVIFGTPVYAGRVPQSVGQVFTYGSRRRRAGCAGRAVSATEIMMTV